MQETDKTASTSTGNGDIVWPKWMNKVAWFLRITGVLILVISTLGIMQSGWPHSLRAATNLQGLLGGVTLFVMSFLYVTTGKTRNIISVATIVLGVSIIVFALAKLGLPQL